MAVTLEIRDGNPWYLSPDIWTVPGDDPAGAPGLPIAGQNCFIWAHVRNNGTDPVSNATVRFYWGNPGVGFDRTTATPVGTSFVNLNGNDAQDVLCLTPWHVVFVNGGHECVLAEAFCSADPLPPGPDFNVPTDRHVAQRNLTVLATAPGMMFHFPFEVYNPSRNAQVFTIGAELGDVTGLKPLVKNLGPNFRLPTGGGEVEKLGFVASRCPNDKDLQGAKPKLDHVEVPGTGRTGFSLVGRLKGDAALVHVTQRIGTRETGGLSVLVIKDGKEGRK
jgi:hypothetical protein